MEFFDPTNWFSRSVQPHCRRYQPFQVKSTRFQFQHRPRLGFIQILLIQLNEKLLGLFFRFSDTIPTNERSLESKQHEGRLSSTKVQMRE